jgi:two-component system, sensor histidine kinase and response regulator
METLRVLITDDELGMRLGVARTLRDFTVRVPDVNDDVAFVVSEAETGEQALEMIAADPPDILFLDYKMPGISGLDVLDAVTGKYGDMLTIMITAYASIETAVTATKRGAYDFLAKPFTPDELKSTIRKATARLILAKQTRRLAEEKRQVRFEFIRILGHELKAPLGAVEGYLRMFKDRSLGDDAAAYDEGIDRGLIRIEGMKKLIADLLDLTQIESGRKNRRLAPLDVGEVAQSVLDSFAAAASERRIALALSAPAPVPMTADRGELEIVLGNLISNAIKYNRDGGRVEVGIERTDNRVTITVGDTGIGLTEEESKMLFGEFVRIKNEKTAHILGSGLGLSIVKKVAQLYAGDAAVASTPNTGSTFTVTLRDDEPR